MQTQFDFTQPAQPSAAEKPRTQITVNALKENGQDFEWYPTTNEMIEKIKCYIPEDASSILDIGAGDGRVLESLGRKCKNASLYAIEKSSVLIQQQDKNIIPAGTEFYEQNLTPLKVEYVFCNPPYSDFEGWTSKIIAEAYAIKVFLVIPTRWNDSKVIKKALDDRDATTRTIMTGDFANADRKARAVVEIIEVTYSKNRGYASWQRNMDDPFDAWFDANVDTFDKAEEIKDQQTSEELARKYSHASVEEMETAYLAEYALLEKNYRKIFELDYAILKELNIDKKAVREGLKLKISGLKIKYWQVLFSRIDAITNRLTTGSRGKLLGKLTQNNTIDFTAQNAYAVILWAIKNANQYFDDQAVSLFYKLSTFEGALRYKSNQKTWEKSDWKFRNGENSHYKLDYLVISSQWKAINAEESWKSYEYPQNLSRNVHDLISDIVAVLSNLGFNTSSPNSYNRGEWERGQWQDWTHTGSGEVLFQTKAYLNGNVHIRFMQNAIKALNIEVARILKWINSPEEVITELEYTADDAAKYYNSTTKILPSSIKLLGS